MFTSATHYIDNLVPARGRFPYYIVTPAYIRTSAGIRALHVLCHWLNMTGQSAFLALYPDWEGLQVNPELQTPVLTEAVAAYHFETGATPIMIYPEVVAGNPFGAPVRVRWIANYPGLLGGTLTYDADELCFAHSEHLAKAVGTPNILSIPVLDTATYRPTPMVGRAGTCFYAGKFQAVHGQKVFGLPPGCVEIPRDRPDEWSPSRIANLFRSSELFYCFEDTALINEAALCGCPVVLMKNDFFHWPLAIDEVGWDGYAWGDSDEEVERAKRTVAKAYDNYARNIPRFFTQLHHFVLVSQKRASVTPYVKPIRMLSRETRALDLTSSWRGALGEAVLELASLRSNGSQEKLLWTPEIYANGARSAVTFISGWAEAKAQSKFVHCPISSFAIVPPSGIKKIDVELVGTSGSSFQLLCDGDILQSFMIGEDGHQILRIAVLEQMRPIILSIVPFSLDHESRNAANSVSEIEIINVKGLAFVAEAQADSQKARADLSYRYVLSVPIGHSIASANCTARYDVKGLMIEGLAPDPNVMFSLEKRLLTKTKAIYLWGVYEAEEQDELQVFLPLPETGEISEAISSRAKLDVGLHAFVLTLPRVEELRSLRIDPSHCPRKLLFRHLELIVVETLVLASAFSGGAVRVQTGAKPNLDGFSRYSLVNGLDVSFRSGCSVAARNASLLISTTDAKSEIIFTLSETIDVPAEAELFLVGDYEADMEDTIAFYLPSPTDGTFREEWSVKINVHHRGDRFSVMLPQAATVHLLRMIPPARMGTISFSTLEIVVTAALDPLTSGSRGWA